MLAMMIAAAALASSAGPPPVGAWSTGDTDSLVRISACGDAVCGYPLIPPLPPGVSEHLDVHNPDPALRGRPMHEIQILGLKPATRGVWLGWIYSPRNGRMYKARLKMLGHARLKLTGCLVGPLCESQTWTRADDAANPGGAPG